MADATAAGVTLTAAASLIAGAALGQVPFFHRPAGVLLERLEWLTDVLPTFTGGEQRRQLRIAPRRSFEFEVVLMGRDRRAAENALHDWGGRAWSLPVWMDAQPLAAALPAGATSIPADTTTRDFAAGGSLAIMTDARAHEILQIDTFTDSAITVLAPTGRDWPAGAIVVPLRAARMADDVAMSRFDGETSYGRLRFEVVAPSDWTAAVESTYRGLPVLGAAPNWTDDVEQGFARLLQRIDGSTGLAYTDDQAAGPMLLQSHRWLLDGRAAIDAFRRWLYARRGRLSAFWLPTFAQDFALVASIGSTALTMDVEHCGYTQSIGQAINRRDVRIELHGGTVFHRRITASTEVSGDVERLSIDATLGVLVTPAQVRSISYMAPVRLEADAIEIAWSRFDVAESRAMTRGSLNDL